MASDPESDDRFPIDPDNRRRRKVQMLAGVGVPCLMGGIVAGLLGIPWWIVVAFLVIVAAGIVLNA